MQDVGSLQLHGTGTPLGDPIEAGAALAVLRPASTKIVQPASTLVMNHQQPLALVACKSALGHAEPAAGALGLVHALLALRTLEEQPLQHLNEVGHIRCMQRDVMRSSSSVWVWNDIGSGICTTDN